MWLKNSRLYGIWQGMKNRCERSKTHYYWNYGGRGIGVCDDWQNVVTFFEWAENNGYAAGLQIDRIDSSKGYYPDNCRWVTSKRQQRNRKTNRLIEFRGKTMCMADWADEYHISANTLKKRLKMGWTIEEALMLPVSRCHILGDD